MAKRPLLVVGAGAVVITVLEGIACGNPVSPRCPGPRCQLPPPEDSTAVDATGDAGIDAGAAITPDGAPSGEP